MKQAIDTKTGDLLPVLADLVPPVDPVRRPRGRPPSGNAQTAAQRQAARRERLKASGVEALTFLVDDEVAAALRKFVEFKDMTQAEAINKILRDRLLRKR